MRKLTVLILGLAFFAGSAKADFDYPEFLATDVGNFTFVGGAELGEPILHVYPDYQLSPSKAAVWTVDQFALINGFTVQFEFEYVNALGGAWADGMAFVIQNDAADALGDHANAQGYGGFLATPANGIAKSVAVEFDNFWNDNWVEDPNDNHIAIMSMGTAPNSQDHGLAGLAINSSLPDFGQGSGTHTVIVEYTPGTMTVYMDDPTTPAMTAALDLASTLDSDSGWLGFTASGATNFQNVQIKSWSLVTGSTAGQFTRGDANDDGSFDISDAVFTLSALFVPGAPPSNCDAALDTNDDGAVDIADAVFSLGALFIPGASPPPPPVSCGSDPTPDSTTCDLFDSCP